MTRIWSPPRHCPATLLGATLIAFAAIFSVRGQEIALSRRRELRVMTYNVQFLPGAAAALNKRPQPAYRASRIAERIAQYDIIALQEAFDDQHRELIVGAVREAWGGRLHQVFSPQPAEFFTSGGCLILSRLPIIDEHSMVFENFSRVEDFGHRADGLAAKGVVHARIAWDDGDHESIDVFATHLEARDDDLRPRQYAELAQFLRLHCDASRPTLLMGDFNTRGGPTFQQSADSQYAGLLKRLNEARPEGGVTDVWAALRQAELGGTTDQQSDRIGKRIDYLFLSNPAQTPPALTPRTVDVHTFNDARVGALSDHNAVAAELTWERK